MNIHLRSNLFASVLPLFIGSCAHTAATTRPTPAIDGGAIARSVVLCKTTESELREKLGTPTRDGILHHVRIESWITRRDSPVSYLAILVDERGVVVDLYWDIPTEIPWLPTNQCLRQN